MIIIDPSWKGDVTFYELLYGTWLTYLFCIFLWSKVLKAPLEEWRYIMLTLVGAAAFWINHYFQNSPFYITLLNTYSLVVWIVWYFVAVKPQGRGWLWQVGAMLSFIVFTIAFICFEYISRIGVETYGVHEFWFMLTALIGFIGIVLWRGRHRAMQQAQ